MTTNLSELKYEMPEYLCKMLATEFFEMVPFNVAVIDNDANIIVANKNFETYFGDWHGKRCHEVYHHTFDRCPNCKAQEVFRTGIACVNDEGGYDRNGRACHFIVHLAPVRDEIGMIKYVIEMSTDIINTSLYQKEYHILFERVPCYISVIDRDFKIVRANDKLRDTFGNVQGKYCYEVFKKRKSKCPTCPAILTFISGKENFSTEVGLSNTGEEMHYVVNTTPLSIGENGVNLVLEISSDITELSKLQDQLNLDHEFYNSILENLESGIVAIDKKGKPLVFNSRLKVILSWNSKRKPSFDTLKKMLPKEFFNKADGNGLIAEIERTSIHTHSGEEIPIKFTALELKNKNEVQGRVAFIKDLR